MKEQEYETAPVFTSTKCKCDSMIRYIDKGAQRAHLLQPNGAQSGSAGGSDVDKIRNLLISAFSENASAVRHGLNIEEKII